MSLSGLVYWATVISGSSLFSAIALIHYFPFALLNSTFLYFYVRAVVTEKTSIKRWDYLHFIPFVLMAINVTPFSLQSWNEKVHFSALFVGDSKMIYQAYLPIIPVQVYFFARFILGTLYIVYAFMIVLKAIHEGKSKVFKELIVWLNIVLGLGFLANLFGVLFTVQNLLMNNFILILEGQGTGRILFVMFSSVLIVSIYFFPKILYGLNTSTGEVTLASVYELNETNSRISKSADISERRLEEIDRLIVAYLPRKNYLIPSFSISDLVKDLEVPLHVLSIYFNSHKGITFTGWKNQLRIEEAIRLMRLGRADVHTLESVGIACGYKSRSNFIQAFKSQTGESPSEYLKKLG